MKTNLKRIWENQSEPKPKTKNDKKKLEEITKYFNELRHKYSKKEIDE